MWLFGYVRHCLGVDEIQGAQGLAVGSQAPDTMARDMGHVARVVQPTKRRLAGHDVARLGRQGDRRILRISHRLLGSHESYNPYHLLIVSP